jgi:hypothetical protein
VDWPRPSVRLVVVADWLGGRQMYSLRLGQIYQRFRAGVAPLPPLARGIRNAALLLAVAVVAYYLSRS